MAESIKNDNAMIVVLALSVPFATVWLITQIQFWLGAVIANPIGDLVAFGVGILLASKVRFSKKWHRTTFIAFYSAALFGGIAFVALITSCLNGDCI